MELKEMFPNGKMKYMTLKLNCMDGINCAQSRLENLSIVLSSVL